MHEANFSFELPPTTTSSCLSHVPGKRGGSCANKSRRSTTKHHTDKRGADGLLAWAWAWDGDWRWRRLEYWSGLWSSRYAAHGKSFLWVMERCAGRREQGGRRLAGCMKPPVTKDRADVSC